MKPLIFLGTGVLVFTIGALLVIKRGVELKPTYIMKPTSFENPGDLGRVLAQRFYNETKTAKSFAYYDSPLVESSNDIFEAFVKEAKKNAPQFKINYVKASGKELPKTKEDFQMLISPVAPSSEYLVRLPFECADTDDQTSLACLAVKATKAYYRKRLHHKKYGAIMYKYSKSLHVLYVWEP